MLTTPPEVETMLAETAEPSAGFWLESWRRFRKRKLAVVALAFVLTLTAIAAAAPLIAGTRPIVVRYKGELYVPAMWYYNRSWENPVFNKDRFRANYIANLKAKD